MVCGLRLLKPGLGGSDSARELRPRLEATRSANGNGKGITASTISATRWPTRLFQPPLLLRFHQRQRRRLEFVFAHIKIISSDLRNLRHLQHRVDSYRHAATPAELHRENKNARVVVINKKTDFPYR